MKFIGMNNKSALSKRLFYYASVESKNPDCLSE